MDNKNLLIAIVLSLIILFGWGKFAEYMGWVKPPVPQEQAENRPPVPQTSAPTPQLPDFKPETGREFTVSTPLYEARFHIDGGPLRSFVLKKYHEGILADSPLVNMVDANTAKAAPLGIVINGQGSWRTGQWTLKADDSSMKLADNSRGEFVLEGVIDGMRVQRHFFFDSSTYLIREKIRLFNDQDHTRNASVTFTQAMDSIHASGDRYDSMRLAWDNNGSLEDESSSKTLETTGFTTTGKIWWAGPMSTYFLAAVMPGLPDGVIIKGRLQDNVWRAGVMAEPVIIEPGKSFEMEAAYWTGPKVRSMLLAVSDQLVKSIDLGFFSVIAKGLLWLLEFFHKYVNNWGVAIILLTLVIRAAFWPLTSKSLKSMEKMKQLQPVMVKIREKYKNDREQMNKETMALYKSYGVNPASGCVPILIQLPVFFGLYQALLTSIVLRHASFIPYFPGTHVIWLADLSAKDPLYITPIVMGLTMFIQQRMSPPPADPMQRKIMMFLPLIFTVLFLNFPAGLVIYWLMNNIVQILQQWLVMRHAAPLVAPKADVKQTKK